MHNWAAANGFLSGSGKRCSRPALRWGRARCPLVISGVRCCWALQETVLPGPGLAGAWGKPGMTSKLEKGFCRDPAQEEEAWGTLHSGRKGKVERGGGPRGPWVRKASLVVSPAFPGTRPQVWGTACVRLASAQLQLEYAVNAESGWRRRPRKASTWILGVRNC